MWRRRLWKSVQLEALETWGWEGAEKVATGAGLSSCARLRAHLPKAASAGHPGLDVELAVGGKAQLLGGHVQDPAAKGKA